MPVGAVLPSCVAVPVHYPSGSHGQGAGYFVPGHRRAPHHQHRRGDPHLVFRQYPESQHPFPRAVSKRRVCDYNQTFAGFLLSTPIIPGFLYLSVNSVPSVAKIPVTLHFGTKPVFRVPPYNPLATHKNSSLSGISLLI